ncbi:hypothetical protein D3C78_1628230 [compost metagenome]
MLGFVSFHLGKNPASDQALQALQILLSAAAGAPPPVAQALEKLSQESLALIEEQLRIGIAAGEIRADLDPASGARVVLGLMRGVSGQFALGLCAHETAQARDATLAVLEQGLRP